MSTVFTRIIAGEIPGTFVWRDERCVAFLSVNPMATGHVLVVPIEEIDHWLDAPADLAAHLFEVTRVVGEAQQRAFRPERIGVIVAGYEVPHAHIHVIPTTSMDQLAFANAAASVDRTELDTAAAAIRAELVAMGRTEVADAPTGGEGGTQVRGTVTYRQRVALAPGAVVTVEVRDVSVADAPSVTVAEQVLRPEHQVPIPFSIDVGPGRLVGGRRYGVAARIDVDGHLAWISDTHHPVATTGTTEVEIVVVPASAA